MNGLVFSESDIVDIVVKSKPLRATDWRKSRLSSGVYCVVIEGIPYSIVDFSRST